MGGNGTKTVPVPCAIGFLLVLKGISRACTVQKKKAQSGEKV